MHVLVDSSIWIDFFRSGDNSTELDCLIDNNLVCTNDLILTELIPFLQQKKQTALINLLKEILCFPLSIDWLEIQNFQLKCIENGINGFGIPDLIIVQNALQTETSIYSLDKHFKILKDVLDIKIFSTIG